MKIDLLSKIFDQSEKNRLDALMAKEKEEAEKDISRKRFASYFLIDLLGKSIIKNFIMSVLLVLGLFLVKMFWIIGSAFLMVDFAFMVYTFMADLKYKKYLISKYFTEKIEQK